MSLHVEGQAPIHIPAYPVKVRDVSGAGDTVAAVMAVLLAMKTPYEFAMRAANAAAAVVVGKRGTVDGFARRIAPPHPAGGFAGARGQDRLRLVGA